MQETNQGIDCGLGVKGENSGNNVSDAHQSQGHTIIDFQSLVQILEWQDDLTSGKLSEKLDYFRKKSHEIFELIDAVLEQVPIDPNVLKECRSNLEHYLAEWSKIKEFVDENKHVLWDEKLQENLITGLASDIETNIDYLNKQMNSRISDQLDAPTLPTSSTVAQDGVADNKRAVD